MKGRITCPNCGRKIIAEINKEVPIFAMDCPDCNHHFNVNTSQVDCSNIKNKSKIDGDSDCDWEEHGEPRKTILSSIKPRTDKPMIASFLLIGLVIIAIFSAFFPTIFLQAPIQIASLSGIEGGLSIQVENGSQLTFDQIIVHINQDDVVFEKNNDSFHFSSLSLGEHVLTITNLNNNASITKNVYILPFDLSSYSINIIDTTPLKIENNDIELEWLSTIILILAIVTIVGAFMCWRRKHSDVALVCSIIGIFTIGLYFSGIVLGFIAIILIIESRDEFEDGKKGKSF